MALLLTPGGVSAQALPPSIPIFPLPDVVLFPDVSLPLMIFEPRYRAMIADALKGDRIIGMVLLRPGFEADYAGRPPIFAETPPNCVPRSFRCVADFRPGSR